MIQELLVTAGLTPAQIKAYLALVEKGELTPPQVAELAQESRTNAYMILDKLEELGLIEKVENVKKAVYRAKNPVALEKLVEERRKEIMRVESQVRQAMPQLLSYFYTFTEKPGVRFFEGADAMREVYRDILRTKQTLYLIRGKNIEQEASISKDFIEKYIAKRVSLGISVVALTPDSPDSNRDAAVDKFWLMDRTWLPADLYDEPVEINIYGSKVAFLSFGHELFGTVIESPQLAQAMRKIVLLIKSLSSSN